MAAVLEKGCVENSGCASIWMGRGVRDVRGSWTRDKGLLDTSPQATNLGVITYTQYKTPPFSYKTAPIPFSSC